MDKATQEKAIEGAKLIAMLGISLGAYALGAHDLSMFIAGGALGHAIPGRRALS